MPFRSTTASSRLPHSQTKAAAQSFTCDCKKAIPSSPVSRLLTSSSGVRSSRRGREKPSSFSAYIASSATATPPLQSTMPGPYRPPSGAGFRLSGKLPAGWTVSRWATKPIGADTLPVSRETTSPLPARGKGCSSTEKPSSFAKAAVNSAARETLSRSSEKLSCAVSRAKKF